MTEANLNPSPNTVISSIILNNILRSAAFPYTRVAQKIENKLILNMLSPRNQRTLFIQLFFSRYHAVTNSVALPFDIKKHKLTNLIDLI